MKQKSVLVILSDPGANNFLLPIASFLQHHNNVKLYASGQFANYRVNQFPSLIESYCNNFTSLKDFTPDVVIYGTCEEVNRTTQDMIKNFSNKGVMLIAIVDSLANIEKRFAGEKNKPLEYAPNKLIVPDQITRKNFEQLGYPSDQIYILRNPAVLAAQSLHTDDYKTKYDKKIITFVSERSKGLSECGYRRNSDYTLHGSGRYEDRTSIVIEEFIRSCDRLVDRSKYWMILRPHPKQLVQDFGDYIHWFDEISNEESTEEIIQRSKLIVGMSTQLLVQSHAAGINTFSILPRECEKFWLTELVDGSIDSAINTEEIDSLMRRNLKEQRKVFTKVNIDVDIDQEIKQLIDDFNIL